MIRPIPLGSISKPPIVQLFAWDNVKCLEAGDPLDASVFDEISLQIEGQFGGATVNMEGSNDGNRWYTLIDSQDNHMSFSFPGLADIGQFCRYIRPNVMGGDETTDISVMALCKGAR